MATAPVKSKPLHNFSLSFLKWGTHHNDTAASTPPTNHRQSEPDADPDSDRSSQVPTRSNRVGSRSTRLHRYSFSSLASSPSSSRSPSRTPKLQRETKNSESQQPRAEKSRKEVSGVGNNGAREEVDGEEEEEETVQRPWNLRPRRGTTCSSKNATLQETGGGDSGVQEVKQRGAGMEPKSMRLRGLAAESAGGIGGGERKKEKERFWISLSKEEIEEDIFSMTGSRPARRPKKRSKSVQKQLDNVFPGLWLVGTTADSYKVDDTHVKI